MGMPEIKMALVRNKGTWMTVKEISAFLSQNENTVRNGITRLLRWKEIEERKRAGTQCYEYRIKEEPLGSLQPDTDANKPPTA